MKIDLADFEKYITTKQGLALSSITTYLKRLIVLDHFLDERHAHFDAQSLEEFVYHMRNERGIMNSTMNSYFHAFRQFKLYLKHRRQPYAFLNNLEELPDDRKSQDPPTEEEYEKILAIRLKYRRFGKVEADFLNDVYTTLGWFLLDSGCRFDEATTIPFKNFRLAECTALLEKSKSQKRKVYYSGRTADLLRLMLERMEDWFPPKASEDMMFTNAANHVVHAGEFNDAMKRRAQQLGIDKDIHAHIFRHIYATEQWDAGNDLAAVANLLGNKDVQTVYETYISISDPARKKAAYKLPRLALSADPLQILKNFKDYIERYKLDENPNLSPEFKKGLLNLFFEETQRLLALRYTTKAPKP